MCYTMHMALNEDMGTNEDVMTNRRSDKIRLSARNSTRNHVSSFRVVILFSLALLALTLWLLRLIGILTLV